MFSGGGFGRRLEPDFVSEAVRVSQAVGVPVKVIWSREDDMRNGFYRPTSYNRFTAGLDASVDTAPPDPTIDPTTCDEAATRHTYVGCDYWPTVVANNVWSVFDYAVVVANAGDQHADVHVTGNGVDRTVTVAPGTAA